MESMATIPAPSTAPDNRFARFTTDNHSAPIWIASLQSLIFAFCILAVRLGFVKWNAHGLDDVVPATKWLPLSSMDVSYFAARRVWLSVPAVTATVALRYQIDTEGRAMACRDQFSHRQACFDAVNSKQTTPVNESYDGDCERRIHPCNWIIQLDITYTKRNEKKITN
ncbi:hypothetical protein CC80DRAFT_189113 [Byssothecium circinans]|uniref:Uncharacterized protein n=1 Tax=Byssothecium circinans TaxID=147558 RepID=A0A6A5TSH6_9PLEO|nr:hypothetical protein CC80DRAFT_189113 [Byssothecium circinans]